jgi:hypothetical protein
VKISSVADGTEGSNLIVELRMSVGLPRLQILLNEFGNIAIMWRNDLAKEIMQGGKSETNKTTNHPTRNSTQQQKISTQKAAALYLGTIGPVQLIAVVILRVMRGSHHYASYQMLFFQGEWLIWAQKKRKESCDEITTSKI